MFHVSDTRGRSDYTMGRVVRMESSGEILGAFKGREPNGTSIYENRPGKGHIGDKYGFLLVTTVGTSGGFEDVDTGLIYVDLWLHLW